MNDSLAMYQSIWRGTAPALADGTSRLEIVDRDALVTAFDAFDKGLGFADALHGNRSARAAAFETFDRRLAKRAKAIGVTPRVELVVLGGDGRLNIEVPSA